MLLIVNRNILFSSYLWKGRSQKSQYLKNIMSHFYSAPFKIVL